MGKCVNEPSVQLHRAANAAGVGDPSPRLAHIKLFGVTEVNDSTNNGGDVIYVWL